MSRCGSKTTRTKGIDGVSDSSLALCRCSISGVVRRFCEAAGKPATTARIDAEMLARYSALLDPCILKPSSQTINDLKELHMARLALVKDRTAAKDREKKVSQAILKQQNAARLKQIDTQIKAHDKAITALIKSGEDLAARHDIIVSIPGRSSITAFALLTEMRELGQPDEKSAAVLAGLAPVSNQSGQWTGRASIAGGRAIVRQALNMPTLVVARDNPDLTAKHQSLIKAGKPPKATIIAIMRKLIILANALLRKNVKWAEKHA